MSTKILMLALSFTGLFYHSSPGQCDRGKMVEDYNQYFLGTAMSTSELGWSGDEKACEPGEISGDAMHHMVERINYYRRLAGVNTSIGVDTSLTAMCQQAALMMHSNNQLSHDPPDEWSCWSEDGKTAASRSNLALGAHSVNALSLYMRDPGASNYAVGHRRWILYSRAKEFGLGSTSRAHALYVIHNKQDAPEGLDFIAYPNPGFFPAPLLSDRWSFSKPNANFSETTVKLFDSEEQEIPVEIQPVKNGYGDNTIVWVPESGAISGFLMHDVTYQVEIANVHVGDTMLSYTYEVIISPTQHPPLCADQNMEWDEESCGCQQSQTTSAFDLEAELVLDMYPNPASEVLYIELLHPASGAKMEIHNMTGQLVQQLLLKGRTADVDVRQLPEGIYQLSITKGRDHFAKSFVVQH